jgi:CheY-like chemotaxis protein
MIIYDQVLMDAQSNYLLGKKNRLFKGYFSIVLGINSVDTANPIMVCNNLQSEYIRETHLPVLKHSVFQDCKVLVIEDDYVNYLLISEMLSGSNIHISRALSLDDAIKQKERFHFINLLIINISLTCGAQRSAIDFLKEAYSVPVLVVDSGDRRNIRYKEIVDWADGILDLNIDSEYYIETISDMLGVPAH